MSKLWKTTARILPALLLTAAGSLGLQAQAQGQIPPMHEKGAVQYSCGGIGSRPARAGSTCAEGWIERRRIISER